MSQILIWLYEQVLLIISPRPVTSTTKENCFTKLKICFLCILRSWFWSKFSMLIIFRYFPQKNVLWDFMSHVWGDVEAPLRFIMCFHTHARCVCVCVCYVLLTCSTTTWAHDCSRWILMRWQRVWWTHAIGWMRTSRVVIGRWEQRTGQRCEMQQWKHIYSHLCRTNI